MLKNLTNQKSLTSLGNKLVIAGALVQHAKYALEKHNALGPHIWHAALMAGQ